MKESPTVRWSSLSSLTPHIVLLCSAMLPEAVLPPSEEHSYAQWLERTYQPKESRGPMVGKTDSPLSSLNAPQPGASHSPHLNSHGTETVAACSVSRLFRNVDVQLRCWGSRPYNLVVTSCFISCWYCNVSFLNIWCPPPTPQVWKTIWKTPSIKIGGSVLCVSNMETRLPMWVLCLFYMFSKCHISRGVTVFVFVPCCHDFMIWSQQSYSE